MSDTKRINDDGKLEIKDAAGNWVEVPDHAVARLTAVVNPAEGSRLAALARPAAESAMVDSGGERKKFEQVTGLQPADWLDKLRGGKILERTPRVEYLYKAACELTGSKQSVYDLM